MDRPGQDDDLDDDDNQYVVEDSTPLAPPTEEAFASKDNEIAHKPEGWQYYAHIHCRFK